ncbi:Wzz/FepE/Etk N-terminal domain-containing protein [uncultured Tateyamaria sp.]|uniref:GumC family protein n=1 Tax=uncultured Tateyamaria sp. TaxID=455651 RepID=UPI00262BD803|nr:Wzz/FepE/Etk N-terminal domain-containing protein [uncultured Tateyamaria sp.]
MLDVAFYFALFLRRLPYFLIFVVAGTAIGVALALTLPPSYEAQARLVVESEQIPDELAASTVRTEASEQLQIIQQRILTRDTLLDMANRLNIYAGRGPGERLRPDEMVSDLRSRIRIRTTGGRGAATLVNISFSAPSANLASQVTNEVVTAMLEENVRMRTGVSGQTLEFFEQEVARLDQELARRGSEIIAFQEANKEALPDSLEFRRGQLAAAQERLLQLTREEAALNDRRAGLVAFYEATGNVVGLNQQTAQAGVSPSEARLRQLRERYSSSVAVLSLDNPRNRVLKQQIDALEKIVAEEQKAFLEAQTGGEINSETGAVLSIYDIQIADLDNQLEFIASRRAEIEEEMAGLRVSIDATPANTIALNTLERDFAAARLQYDQAVINKGRAETGDIIEALSKGERISVIEQAVPPAEPTSPNRPKLAIAGMGGGIMAGFGFIVLLELLNTSIRRPKDIVQKLEITPFGVLPYIRTRRDRIRRRFALIVVLLAVAGVIVGGLWAIDTYVMPLDLLLKKIMDRLPSSVTDLLG